MPSDVEWGAGHGEVFLKFMDDALDKLPSYTQEGILLRMELREYKKILEAQASNTPLIYPNFISAAKSNKSGYIDGGNKENILFEVDPNSSVKMVDLQPFSRVDDELEILIGRNSKKLITKTDYKDFPASSDYKLYAWITSYIPTGFLDANGIPIRTNPNALDPIIYTYDQFLAKDFSQITSEQLAAAKKILTVSVKIIE